MKNDISTVAVVGADYMGGGIAQVLAGAGIDVVISEHGLRTAWTAPA